MNEYDAVELTVDQPDWTAKSAVVDQVAGEDVVSVEFFYRPNEESVVHLTPLRLLRVTDRYVPSPLTETAAPHRSTT